MKKTILNFVAAAMFVAASLPAHAQGFVYDQQSATAAVSIIGNGNADGLNIQEDSPLTQSFVPTLSAISFVQFEFWDIPNNGNNGATVYVNLWTGSPNINSATFISSTTPVYMPNGFMNSGLATAGVTNFYFSTAINLIAGQTYYLQPVVLSGDDPWDIITIGDTYSNGQLYGGAGGFTAPFQPSTDLWFREGVVATPEPSSLALAGLSSVLACVIKRRTKPFILSIIAVLRLVENKTIKTMILNLMAAMFVAASLQTHAQGFVFDQQSATQPVALIGNGNADGLDIQEDSPLLQSFIPSLSAIQFAQLEFADFPNNGTSGATVYVNLWTGSPNVNSATFISSTTPVYMPNGFVNSGLAIAGVTNFYFPTAIALTPGQTYYLQPVVESGDDPWDIITIGDTYANGRLYGKTGGYFQPSTDLYFREGVLATPEPAILALISLGIVLFFVFRCRSKLVVLSNLSAFLLVSAHAQTNSDSVVQITADLAGLTHVSAIDLPATGTFFIMQPNASGQITSLPFPALPAEYANLPIYQVTGNTFIIDDTSGRLRSPSALPSSQSAAAQVQAQIRSLSGLISQLQIWTNNYGVTNTAHPNTPNPAFSTNGLWLEIYDAPTNVLLILHNTIDTNFYQINYATNLLSTNWTAGDLLPGDWESDQTWFWPVDKHGPATFYRAHEANAIMQVWDVMDAQEPNVTNSGNFGIIGFQNGDGVHTLTNDLKVYYALTGTATNGIDYTNLPGVITLLAGMVDTNILIQPKALGLQPDKTIVLTLLQNSNYLIDREYVFTTNILYANPEVAPVANGDKKYPCPNTAITFPLQGQDAFNSLLTYTIVTWPDHGTLDTNNLNSTPPNVTYTPTNCFEGIDVFTFKVNNGYVDSAPTNVTLSVSDPVFANNAAAATIPGQPVSFSVVGGEDNVCAGFVNYIVPTSLPHGILNTSALPSVTYTSTTTNLTGIETFNYDVISSCGGDTATSSVTIYIAGGPILTLGCNPFGAGTYVPLEWFLGTNELQMQQQLNDINDYKIYRSAVSGGPYACIYTNTDLTQSTYMDTSVVAGQTNYYVVTFEFSANSTSYESPFSDEIKGVASDTYDLIPPDATWDVWDVSTNHLKVWLGYLPAPFSNYYPGQYPGISPSPNTYWPAVTNQYFSIWSNNITLVLPANWTNITQLAQVKYSITIDNDYWLYLNHYTNFIDSTNHDGTPSWGAFQSFETVAPGLLHGGTNTITVLARNRGGDSYFSMVVTTNACGQ